MRSHSPHAHIFLIKVSEENDRLKLCEIASLNVLRWCWPDSCGQQAYVVLGRQLVVCGPNPDRASRSNFWWAGLTIGPQQNSSRLLPPSLFPSSPCLAFPRRSCWSRRGWRRRSSSTTLASSLPPPPPVTEAMATPAPPPPPRASNS